MTVAETFETLEYGPAPESATPTLDWIADHDSRFDHFINGEWCAPNSGQYFSTTNPANGDSLAEVSQGNVEDVDGAVSAAATALPAWQALTGHQRARYLYALARQVQKHARLFAVLETLDNGKPIRETRDIDIPLVARHFYHHAGWAQLMDLELRGHEPLGVVGQIIPWNFPLLMLAWKVAPAIATGNTVVLKPAEYTPLTALLFGEICQRIGLPPGVVNIVTGDGSTGEALVQHPGIAKIAFTGSTEVGKRIREITAGSGKRLSLELGGKSPFIVFDDADLDSVVEGVVDAIWFNQGQVCCAGSRLLIQETIHDKLVRKLRARMEKLRVGDPMDKAVDIGAIVAPVQLERIERLVRQSRDEGCEVWQPSGSCPKEGLFYPPTLLTNVSPASTAAQVEIFGPVISAMSFRTPVEAIELANNTRYGLAAGVWSENINVALDIAPKIKAGTVWINCTNQFDAASSFGGYRESGFGREGGREGLLEYVRAAKNKSVGASERRSVGTEETAGVQLGTDAPTNQRSSLDRTAKLFIDGKQVRPDSGYSRDVMGASGASLGEVGDGNRKDIRNAVEAAHAAKSWSTTPAHARAQVIYYVAENLEARSPEFAARLVQMTGCPTVEAEEGVRLSIERLFHWAAWADKHDGAVHATPFRNVTLAVNEPVGVVGIACPAEYPLLAFVDLVFGSIALGNRVIAIPSEPYPLAATDLYQVIETSDVPPGVINIVTGSRNALSETLAGHDDVEAMWYFGDADGAKMVERLSAGNLKRTWVETERLEWRNPASTTKELLHQATQVKNIWIPYGA